MRRGGGVPRGGGSEVFFLFWPGLANGRDVTDGGRLVERGGGVGDVNVLS
jgi:hypothetical protein